MLTPTEALSRARALLREGRPTDAMPLFDQALAARSDVAGWRAGRAQCLVKLGRIGEAIQGFHAAIAIKPDEPSYHGGLAAAYARQGDAAEAVEGYRAAVSLDPDTARWHASLARALHDLGAMEAALQSAEISVSLAPDVRSFRIWRDRIQGRAPSFLPKLARMDEGAPRSRFYIAGCGRSGTWLLDSMMAGLSDSWHGREEFSFGHFSSVKAPQRVHVIKRHSYSFEDVHHLPKSIALLYIVRHSFDVLTSAHVDLEYYITPERWTREVAAMRRVVDRGNTLFIRFEDLVRDPDRVMEQIAGRWSVDVDVPFSRFAESTRVTERVAASMHGIRKPDYTRIERYRTNPQHMSYCEAVAPQLADDLRWISESFGYDYPASVQSLLHGKSAR